jgi:uncharacterized protein YkwD
VRHPIVVLVVLLGVAVPPGFATEPPAGARDPLMPPSRICGDDDDPDAHPRVQRLAMHCLVNQVRKRAGVRIVRSSATLRHSATYKARRIAECRTFSHNPCGDRLDASFVQARLTEKGRWLVGEDLAYAVGDRSTARRILAKWLRSPQHRAVLIDKRFRHLGVRKRRLRMRGAPVGSIIWVAHLGRPDRR